MVHTDCFKKIHTGELYIPTSPKLVYEQINCLELLYEYNITRPSELGKRKSLLNRMFAEIGDNCYIQPPFYANFAGKHVHFGKNIYANFNLTLIDDTHIYVGDHTMFGPNVIVATAGHPILPELRRKGYQFNAPVTIGHNCWIGAGTIIVPGVTIGDNVVIGAGSIVTKNIPSNVVAMGNPCRINRVIGEHDKKIYYKDQCIPNDLI